MNTERTGDHLNPRFARRQFLKIVAVAGSLAGAGALGVDALHTERRLHRIQTTRLLLGTVANITLITDRADAAQAAIEATFSTMAVLESVMSRFRTDSQLSHLNRSGDLRDSHPALVDVLQRALHFGALTGGAFDVTVEPVLALYRHHALTGGLPATDEVARLRALVNFRDIDVSADRIHLRQPGMAITLDGIAKGYIIDQGAHELRRRGFEQVLVELGGDMQAQGMAGDRPWQVGLQAPRDSMIDRALGVAQLRDCALATSGDYMQAFTPDFRLHHILMPGTGASPLELSSASVIAPTACDADALATAAIVLGADKTLTLLARLPDVEGLLVGKDGSQTQSAAFPRL